MRRRRTDWSLAVAGAVALMLVPVLSGCGGSSKDTQRTTATAAGEPQRGGTLKASYLVETGCIDPAQNFGAVPLSVARTFTDSLTYQDKSGAIQPWLAASWETSPDLKEFTFKLRDDVTFSDGSPFTATTVKRNLDALGKLGPKAILPAQYLVGYTGATVVDDHTVRVAFDQPNAPFLQATSTPAMGLVSDATTRENGETRCRGELVGTGPFVLKTYTPNRQINVVRRDGYAWAPTGSPNQGEAYLDGVDFQMVPEQGVRTSRLLAGDLQFVPEVESQDIEHLRGEGVNVLAAYNPGLSISGTFSAAALKDPKSPLSDRAFRQAMQVAVDRDAVVKPYNYPDYKGATSILSPTTPFYTDESDLLKQDVAKANQLLDDAGWTRSGDGVRSKNGVPARVKVLYFAPPSNLGPWLVLQQQLKTVGIDLQIDQVPSAAGSERLAAGDYEMLNRAGTRADPATLNFLLGLDPKLDTYLAQASATLDDAKRQTAVDNAAKLILSDALAIPLYPLLYASATADDVNGFETDVTNWWQLNSVWLDG